MEYRDVLGFWFEDLRPEDWTKSCEDLDRTIAVKFGELHKSCCNGELEEWRMTPRGRLAEILVLDQFSRNIYRNKPKAYYWDTTALVLAQEAIRNNIHQELSAPKRLFLYKPFSHSESPKIQQIAVNLYSEPGLEHNLEAVSERKNIIERFGRYPNRNLTLGRESTTEELEFLKQNSTNF